MKVYAEEKFKTMSMERQIEVLLHLAYKIEASELGERKLLIDIFRSYWTWHFSSSEAGHSLLRMTERLSAEISTQEFYNYIVPLERQLQRERTIDDSMVIESMDRSIERQVRPLILVLDHWRSALNVGSAFRSAEGMGVQEIILLGYTPDPTDARVIKTAMGAQDMVPWRRIRDVSPWIEEHRRQGYKMVGVETVSGSEELFDYSFSQHTVLFLGNERFGLGPELLKKMDSIVMLPLMGNKNSLNVVNCLSVFMYEYLRQQR